MHHQPITPSTLENEAHESLNYSTMELDHLIKKHGNSSFYCIVEGKTDPWYYRPRIIQYTRKDVHFVIGYDRKKVILLYDYVHKKSIHEKIEIGFFIDKDYENNDNIPDSIYITPCYGIENFYCSPRAFNSILTDLFFIKENSDIYDEIIKFYHEQYELFINAILPFHTWAYCLYDIGYNIKLKNFANTYITIKPGNIFATQTLEYFQNSYKNAPQIPSEIFNKKYNAIKGQAWCTIRGKDFMYFIYKTIIFIKNELNRSRNSFFKNTPYKCNVDVKEEHLTLTLSSITETPSDLQEYVKSRLEADKQISSQVQ